MYQRSFSSVIYIIVSMGAFCEFVSPAIHNYYANIQRILSFTSFLFLFDLKKMLKSAQFVAQLVPDLDVYI